MSMPVVSIEVMFNQLGLAGISRTNSFDGSTDSTPITTGNSGGASGDAFDIVTGSPRYSATQAHGEGGLSAFNPTAGADCHIDWTGVTQAGDEFCTRMYLFLVSAPAGAQRTAVLLGPGGVVSAAWIFSDRLLVVYTGFSTAFAAAFTTPIPVGQWVRIELRYTIAASGLGTVEMWLYTDADGLTHNEYTSSAAMSWPGGKPSGVEWHLQRDAGGYWFLDDVAVAGAKCGPAGSWTDVTSAPAKRGISTRRGSSRIESPIIRYDAGIATVYLDNTDRRFDPTNTAGPYVLDGRSLVTPMRPIRIRAVWDGITYDVWRGFVDVWDIDWVADQYSEATVRATDGFKVLRNRRRPAVAPVGAGEDTGARISRILDSAGWPVGDREIAVGNSTLQATDLEGDALSELQAATESEIGELYMNAEGKVVFRNRHAVLIDTRSNTAMGTFGTAGTFTPAQAKLNTDDATLWNEIRAQREGGVEQLVGDAASQGEYLARTFQASSLMLEDDTAVAGYGSWILYVSKDPEVRFDAIEIHAHADPDILFPHVLVREIGDRIRIVRQPPGGGSAITRDVFIRGISHVTTGATWITTWTLQSATKYGSFLVLDNPILGQLDENAIAF